MEDYSMPIKEYCCNDCKTTIERLEKINEKVTVPKCEKCGKSMTRIISKSSFILKGNCWAKDNYSTSNQPVHKCEGACCRKK
jgi:putative FmdB family regulatory protein